MEGNRARRRRRDSHLGVSGGEEVMQLLPDPDPVGGRIQQLALHDGGRRDEVLDLETQRVMEAACEDEPHEREANGAPPDDSYERPGRQDEEAGERRDEEPELHEVPSDPDRVGEPDQQPPCEPQERGVGAGPEAPREDRPDDHDRVEEIGTHEGVDEAKA
jgi:hypothetical protein